MILTFHHANLKDGQKPREILVKEAALSHWMWNEPSQSMVLYTIGGIIPVLENKQEIASIVNNNRGEATGEKNEPTSKVRRPPVNVRKHHARKKG
jgi:hypothetical protein